MAINFDKLPDKKPTSNRVMPGIYKFEVVKAEMRAAYDPADPDFLSINLKLSDMDNNHVGFINDKIVENPKPIVGYKISRFLRACDIDVEGSLELSDLAKLVVGAKGFVDVGEFTPEDKDPIAIVNLFDHDCYWTKKERKLVEDLMKPKSTLDAVEDDEEEDDEY